MIQKEEKMNVQTMMKYNVDLVFCIDATGSMKPLLDTVKEKLYLYDTKVENIAVGNNLTLTDKQVLFEVPSFRDAFFELLREKGWKAAERRYLYNWTRLKLWIKMKIPSKYITGVKRIIKGR